MHLEVAERLRAHHRLDPQIARQLDAAWPAFYLGNVAADFQTISDVPRATTHFYNLPPAPGEEAHEVLLERYPQLADAAALRPAHAVFVAGYRAHLLLDLRWYWDVLVPYFIEAPGWPDDHRQRFLVHNTLLTYLDRRTLAALPEAAAKTLAAAEPRGWLPFAGDGDLIRWQEMLVRQLQPGAPVETVAIYAERMRMTPAAFAANLDDPQWMRENVFRRVPLEAVQAVIAGGVEQSVTLVTEYLSPG